MNTQEYLWWIETIRQDEFRKKLPSNIVGYVALTIATIVWFIFIICLSINSPNDKELLVASFVIGLLSFMIGTSSLILGEITSKKSREQIEEVKKIWNSKANENEVVHEKLKWFYAE